MKIALLTDGIYPYVIGGMQKHSFNLAKYFARNKVFVDLYHTNQSEFDISKLEFFSSEEKQFIKSFVIDFPSFGDFPGHYIRESFEYSRRIFKLFSKNSDVDFVYAKGFTAWKLLDEKRKGFNCAPIGVNFHGYEMFQQPASFKSWLEQVLLLRKPVMFNIQNSDYVFSYGGRISEIILKLGIPKDKIIESPAGIESDWMVSEIRKSSQLRKFIFVGRYERRKGIEELTGVLRQLASESNFEFYFVGDIPNNRRINLPQIKYVGKIDNSDSLKSILKSCDVLVCPSYSEGMPNVILEAMASGLAVIATDVGAINKLVSKENGWLIKAGSKEELKYTIVEAIRTPVLKIDEMKEYSLVFAIEFLWSRIIINLVNEISKNSQKKDSLEG
jgi:glycosyltransferase involved in cell wall biosynthesis